MMLLNYASKKDLKASVGEPLRYTETNDKYPDYRPDGRFWGARRPDLQGGGREWFAEIVMKEGKIFKIK